MSHLYSCMLQMTKVVSRAYSTAISVAALSLVMESTMSLGLDDRAKLNELQAMEWKTSHTLTSLIADLEAVLPTVVCPSVAQVESKVNHLIQMCSSWIVIRGMEDDGSKLLTEAEAAARHRQHCSILGKLLAFAPKACQAHMTTSMPTTQPGTLGHRSTKWCGQACKAPNIKGTRASSRTYT